MLIEEKSSGKECISVLDNFTLDREKLIGPQIYQFLLNAIVTVRLSPLSIIHISEPTRP